jgi:hypothetical protein
MVVCLSFELVRDPAARAQDGGGDFREQITGVYLLSISSQDLPTFGALLSFSTDGSLQTIRTVDFGNADLERFGFLSHENGAWEQFVENQVVTTSLYVDYDSNGLKEGIQRVRTTATFSSPDHGMFQTIDGTFTVDYFTVEQDPVMDPPATPDGLTYSGKRLNER